MSSSNRQVRLEFGDIIRGLALDLAIRSLRQAGAEDVLRRFLHGGGILYDLEYLTRDDGRRGAAFGYWAGFAGAGIGVLDWIAKNPGGPGTLEPVESLPSKDDLIARVSAALEQTASRPTVMVMGARGRSGTGAADLDRHAAEAVPGEIGGSMRRSQIGLARDGVFPAVSLVPSGVVRIAELQREGFAYLKIE